MVTIIPQVKEYLLLHQHHRKLTLPVHRPDQIARLKQLFTRGEAARTGAGGAGLGLAIVERIVRGERGRLELLPREGGGLAARMVLPRA